jgi:hypothetical protein
MSDGWGTYDGSENTRQSGRGMRAKARVLRKVRARKDTVVGNAHPSFEAMPEGVEGQRRGTVPQKANRHGPQGSW